MNPFVVSTRTRKRKGNIVTMRDYAQPVATRYASHVTTKNVQYATFFFFIHLRASRGAEPHVALALQYILLGCVRLSFLPVRVCWETVLRQALKSHDHCNVRTLRHQKRASARIN